MYEDSNRNKINMIGAYSILGYDISDERATKLMSIPKSNIDKKSKSAPSNTDFSRIYPYIFWQGINKAVLSITEYYWMSKTIYDIKISSKLSPNSYFSI